MQNVTKTRLTGTALFLAFLIVSCYAQAPGNKSPQAFRLKSVLTGEPIYYDEYVEFEQGFDKRSQGKPGGPIDELSADAKGGSVKYYEYKSRDGMCSIVFTWSFDRNITEVKAGSDVGVTLNYNIAINECVEHMAGSWMAFSVNDNYYEMFSEDAMFEKIKQQFPAGVNFEKGPVGGALEVVRDKPVSSSTFKIHFPDSVQANTYFPLKISIFRYYFPNLPVAAYVFEPG